MAASYPLVDHIAARIGHRAGDRGVEAILSVLNQHLLARRQFIRVFGDRCLASLYGVSDNRATYAHVPPGLHAVKLEGHVLAVCRGANQYPVSGGVLEAEVLL